MKRAIAAIMAATTFAAPWTTCTGAEAGAFGGLVDFHCHVAGIGAGGSGCFVSPRMRRSWKYRIYLKAFGITQADLLREGDGLVLRRLSEMLDGSRRVSAAVVLALDGVVDERGELDRSRTEMYVPNDFVRDGVRRYQNLLYGASVNPYRKDAIARLEEASRDGAVLVKWLPSIQGIDPADPRLIPFYLRMKALGLPLLTHTGSESSFTCSDDRLSDPERLRLPLRLGVTVIAAHAGGGGRNGGEKNVDRFLRLAQEYANLYADISALTQVNRASAIPHLMSRPELRGRLVYGSDMPLPNTGIVTAWAFPLRLSPARIRAIGRIENPWDRDVALKEALGMSFLSVN
ncbi:MAG TPA: amidohydrolase family protein [Candidatus Deferrimicrobiaceae bacterium]